MACVYVCVGAGWLFGECLREGMLWGLFMCWCWCASVANGKHLPVGPFARAVRSASSVTRSLRCHPPRLMRRVRRPWRCCRAARCCSRSRRTACGLPLVRLARVCMCACACACACSGCCVCVCLCTCMHACVSLAAARTFDSGHDVDAECKALVRSLGAAGWLQYAVGGSAYGGAGDVCFGAGDGGVGPAARGETNPRDVRLGRRAVPV